MSRADIAEKLHGQAYNCAQAVFAALADEVGLDEETALRVAAAFGGGVGRSGLTCGAVTGAMLAIGLKHGRTRPEDEESRERTYRLVHQLVRRFRDRHGSIVCRELIGVDMSKPGWRELAKERNTSTLCNGFIRDAVGIAEEMLKEG